MSKNNLEEKNCKKRILIVEDNTLEAIAIKTMVKNAGYHVVDEIPDTQRAAVQVAMKERPHVTIMDITLLDGKKAGIRAAQEIQEGIDTHIIYVTGVERSPSLMQEVAKTRSGTLLVKPVTEKQLLASIEIAPSLQPRKKFAFISYNKADYQKVKEMYRHLKPLKEMGIKTFIDREISAGKKWRKELDVALENTNVAILMVSIDFLNSKFVREEELPRLLKSAKEDGTTLLPVFLGHVDCDLLEETGILDFQGINTYDDPLSEWKKAKRAREAWIPLVKKLKAAFKVL